MSLGLTQSVQNMSDLWREYITPVSRQDWHVYFLKLADVVSTRSADPRTKHGCILVDSDNSIISTGYNSFVRNIDDSVLPNMPPHKYQFMIHSELNAILNACRHGKSTIGATAYITGSPCNNCLQYLYQAGIKKIIHGSRQSHCMKNSEENTIKNILIHLMKIEVREINIDV